MAAPSEAQQSVLLASLRAHLTAASPSSDGNAGASFDDDILRSLLAVEGWSVSRAVALFKQTNGAADDEGGAGQAASVEADEATARRIQQMEIDDSGVAMGETLRTERAPLWPSSQLHRRAGRGGGYGGVGGGPFSDGDRLQARGGGMPSATGANGGGAWPSVWTVLYQVLTLPFSLTQAVLLFLLRLLRVRPAGSSGGLGGDGRGGAGLRHHPSAGSRMTIDARAAAEQYIRELERDLASSSNGESSSSSSGSRTAYPPLFVGSYSQACQRAKEELKVLAIILTSIDNPDSDIFRKRTFTDPALVETLSRPEFLVWAGDIREREAWQVADICDATTFPFVAFVSLQPSRSGRSASSMPRLAILSRHSGSNLIKPTPSAAASQLHEHLTALLLPRVQPYLTRLRTERAKLASERALRAEQDAAFERAALADVARVRARREAEARRVEEERRRAEEERRNREAKLSVARWRAWARAHLVPPEPESSPSSGSAAGATIVIQFRLPGGRLLSRAFSMDDELEGVFAYVETAVPSPSLDADEPQEAPGSPPAGYEHAYGFELVLGGYPRRKLTPSDMVSSSSGPSQKTRLRDVQGLNDVRRANVIVEGVVAGNQGDGSSSGGAASQRRAGGDGADDSSSGEESD